jgi:hypothetical protein
MTLLTIERIFSNLIQNDTQNSNHIDLSVDGPLYNKAHPKIIWAKLLFEHHHQNIEFPKKLIPDWNYECFSDLISAQKKYPSIHYKIIGRPWAIFQFLSDHVNEVIIDFQNLGTIVLSKKELSVEIKEEIWDYVLPPWIEYTISPELWGPFGKWTRFHSKLHSLFTELNLLSGTDKIGYYPLKAKTSKLESLGFKGTIMGSDYILVLPWCFSLSALNNLEQVLRKEF